MQVLKFGGASVKNADGVKNVVHVLNTQGCGGKLIVVSAMGKMTNALEEVVRRYFENQDLVAQQLEVIEHFHREISETLFPESHSIHRQLTDFCEELAIFLRRNKSENYDYVYDQVVSFGELLSTTIVSAYLTTCGIENTWLDVRELIKTDATYRDAKVNWSVSEQRIKELVKRDEITITQGFIASDAHNWTTTLGREGSDYTAGILAYCLNAESVSIWKNVAGVLNADPREFSETTLLEHISYQEAIELAFYGASVIHPKTLQPLQRKEIPLFVKCFTYPENKGTSVSKGADILPEIPCFIVKNELTLLSLSTLDFSFFVEENMSEVFALFHHYKVKAHLIQNSAISFSVCVDDRFRAIDHLIARLQDKFKVSYNKNVSLFTIRHFDDKAIRNVKRGKSVLLEQRTRETIQLVTKSK